jgi:hypothetical protein
VAGSAKRIIGDPGSWDLENGAPECARETKVRITRR